MRRLLAIAAVALAVAAAAPAAEAQSDLAGSIQAVLDSKFAGLCGNGDGICVLKHKATCRTRIGRRTVVCYGEWIETTGGVLSGLRKQSAKFRVRDNRRVFYIPGTLRNGWG